MDKLARDEHGRVIYSADGDAVLVRVDEFRTKWRHVSEVSP